MKKTQKLLWKLITAPEGVEKSLKVYRKKSLPILGDDRLSNTERLDIYANMYFFRIRDALKEDFPAVLKIIGEDRFHNLITDYLLKYPPTHWSLRYAGQHLPLFLRHHSTLKRWPYLADLARMEWDLMEAFDAPDASVLTAETLSSLKPDQWSELSLSIVPSSTLVSFQWKIDDIFENALKGEKIKAARSNTALLFWRRDLKVYYRSLENLEEKLLRCLKKKTSLGEVCEIVSKEVGEEKSAPLVNQCLKMWVQEGLLKTP